MRRLLLTTLFFPLLISCQKEDEAPKIEQPKVLTKEEILIKHKWVTTDIRVSQGGRVPVIADISCLQDDYFTFSNDGTYKIVNGAICNPENVPFYTGDWKIEGNKYTVKNTYATKSLEYDIVTLNDSIFILHIEANEMAQTETYKAL